MSANQPDDLRLAQQIDAICDRFEAAWKNGEEPQIGQYLDQLDESHQQQLFRCLLQIELEIRPPRHDHLRVYLRRFPQFEETIRGAADEIGLSWLANSPASFEGLASRASETENKCFQGAGLRATTVTPKKIGRFEISQTVGQGSFGVVCRAYDPHWDREVALKVPYVEPQKHAEIQRFLRDARLASQLCHPNICPIYEVGEIDGRPFLVMALILGRALSDALRDGMRMQLCKAVEIVQKLALALDEAHRQGIVHGDLKPANVLIDDADEPVITGFGLRGRENVDDVDRTQAGDILGTLTYMAPEHARGDHGTVGPAADIYSLGVILYELLTNERPFSGRGHEVLAQLLTEFPKPPSSLNADVGPQLEAICLRSLAKCPKDRHTSMRELAIELDEWLRANPRPSG